MKSRKKNESDDEKKIDPFLKISRSFIYVGGLNGKDTRKESNGKLTPKAFNTILSVHIKFLETFLKTCRRFLAVLLFY